MRKLLFATLAGAALAGLGYAAFSHGRKMCAEHCGEAAGHQCRCR